MKIFKSKTFWGIILYTLVSLISLGFVVLEVVALLKYIFG